MNTEPEPTSDDIAISLTDVWVQYQLRHAHHYNFKRTLTNVVTRKHDDAETITALEGINLDIPRGTRLGLTGPNGSGKSTLLAVMAGTLTPSRGTVHTQGRILALLGGPNEGLDPEQTGRENAISLGIRLGESRESMESKLDDIHDFSGLGRRFDHPVYTYSSGMQVRLRFTTITSLQADVLLVDEGIGAADTEFNERASGRLQEFLSSAGALVLASHSEDLLAMHCVRIFGLGADHADSYDANPLLLVQAAASSGTPSATVEDARVFLRTDLSSPVAESIIDWSSCGWDGDSTALSLFGWHRSTQSGLSIQVWSDQPDARVTEYKVSFHNRSEMRTAEMPYATGFRIDLPPRWQATASWLEGPFITCTAGGASTTPVMSPVARSQLMFMGQLEDGRSRIVRSSPIVPVLHPRDWNDNNLDERVARILDLLSSTNILGSADMNLLRRSLVEWSLAPLLQMSIFSTTVESKTIGPYFFDYLGNEVSYYFSQTHLGVDVGGIFTDSRFRILPKSWIITEEPLGLAELIPTILPVLQSSNTVIGDVEKAHAIGVQRWGPIYGHLHDEFYTLASFNFRYPPSQHSLLINDFRVSNAINAPLETRSNLEQMEHLICGEASVNAQERNWSVVQFSGATVLGNRLEYPTFHEFFPGICRSVRASIDENKALNVNGWTRVMLTRGKATHAERNLENQAELEDCALSSGFNVVNPELISYLDLVRLLGSASEIVITWGSALTNLIYAPLGSRVCILQSESYSGENFQGTFGRIAQNYRHNFTILKAAANQIPVSELKKWIEISSKREHS